VSESSGYAYTYCMAHIMLVQTIEWKLGEKQFVDSEAHSQKGTRKLMGFKKCIYSGRNKKKKLHLHVLLKF